MSRQITIEVSDEVAREASRVAEQTSRRVEEVLSGWLESVITGMPVDSLSDHDVMALAELSLPSEQQALLSDLLSKNSEGTLDRQALNQLDQLMRLYERGLLRKSQALRVSVQRGLRAPLEANRVFSAQPLPISAPLR
ncbi:MAG TPA: hypothetical protein VI756_02290 [Blastocatellia bacterium]